MQVSSVKNKYIHPDVYFLLWCLESSIYQTKLICSYVLWPPKILESNKRYPRQPPTVVLILFHIKIANIAHLWEHFAIRIIGNHYFVLPRKVQSTCESIFHVKSNYAHVCMVMKLVTKARIMCFYMTTAPSVHHKDMSYPICQWYNSNIQGIVC